MVTIWWCLLGLLTCGYFALAGYDYGVGMLLPAFEADERTATADARRARAVLPGQRGVAGGRGRPAVRRVPAPGGQGVRRGVRPGRDAAARPGHVHRVDAAAQPPPGRAARRLDRGHRRRRAGDGAVVGAVPRQPGARPAPGADGSPSGDVLALFTRTRCCGGSGSSRCSACRARLFLAVRAPAELTGRAVRLARAFSAPVLAFLVIATVWGVFALDGVTVLGIVVAVLAFAAFAVAPPGSGGSAVPARAGGFDGARGLPRVARRHAAVPGGAGFSRRTR